MTMKQETTSYTNYLAVDGTPCVKKTGKHPDVPVDFANLSERSRKVVQSAIERLGRRLRDGRSIEPISRIVKDKSAMALFLDGTPATSE